MNRYQSDNFGLIKFGNDACLKSIMDGKLWFRTLEYYQGYEASDNISDRNEGITEIIHYDKNTELHFYPSTEDSKFIDWSDLKVPIYMSPRYNKRVFIFCLSYITINDIKNKAPFDNSILIDEKWDSVFHFLAPEKFKYLIMDSLKKNNPVIDKVQYCDFSKNQDDLGCFTKSDKYVHQKEIRIVINYSGEIDKKITRIDNDTIEVNLGSGIEGFISPTKAFVAMMNNKIFGSHQG